MAQLARIVAGLATAQDYRNIHVIGPLFLLNCISAAAIGLALLATGKAIVVHAGIGYAATTLVAFVVSATSGLFGWKETWAGTAQAVAGFTEIGALVLLAALVVRRAIAMTAHVGEG